MKHLVQVDLSQHQVMVNQSGYNLNWAKRFTAPISPDGSDFAILAAGADEVLYRGKIKQGVGDFTDFLPEDVRARLCHTKSLVDL